MAKLMLLLSVAAVLVASCYSARPVTDNEIRILTETLFIKSQPNLLQNIQINVNRCGTCRLLNVSEETLNSVPTIVKMRALFDNYEMDASINEKVTDQEIQEENDFITAVLKTEVMKTLMKFLCEKGHVGNTFASQFSLLRTLWFTIYTRGGGVRGSSGFEHVFLHEIKNGDVSGLHSWIYYHDLEQKRNHPLTFLRVTRQLPLENKAIIIKYRFSFNNIVKPTNTMMVGTLPELDVALYTLCIVLQKTDCKVSMGKQEFIIKAHPYLRGQQVLVGSTYPQI